MEENTSRVQGLRLRRKSKSKKVQQGSDYKKPKIQNPLKTGLVQVQYKFTPWLVN
jgi:hypothetical protein